MQAVGIMELSASDSLYDFGAI